MIKRLKPALTIIIFALISGCATEAVSLSNSKEIPTDRYIKNEFNQPQNPSDLVPVFFKRDTGMTCGGCDMHILIEGKEVFYLNQGEFGKINLKPNVYTITTLLTSPLLAGADRSFQAYVTHNGLNIFRLGLDANSLILFSSDLQ